MKTKTPKSVFFLITIELTLAHITDLEHFLSGFTVKTQQLSSHENAVIVKCNKSVSHDEWGKR